jgi:hypothetical protein
MALFKKAVSNDPVIFIWMSTASKNNSLPLMQ